MNRKKEGINIMETILKNHFSGWYQDLAIHPENYYLVLSDDMDSFYSCRYLKKKTGVEIGGFYDFSKGLYIRNDLLKSSKHPVYVDVACVLDGVMCFDNHRSIGRNHMSINPNIITDRISNKTYYRKYNGSTLMLLVSLFGEDDELTELEKDFLCAIDAFYVGYYKDNGAYKHINIEWLEYLGLKEALLPVLEKHNADYFIELLLNYQLNEKIFIDDEGVLFTYADILPHDKFSLVMPVEKTYLSKSELENYPIADRELFVAAETYSGRYIINSLV
ncbi:MAG: hypothetical protein ACI4EF_02680 [Coprococcus sp.]